MLKNLLLEKQLPWNQEPNMKLSTLFEREDFTSKDRWVDAMVKAGAEEFLQEKEFNIDLIYAIKGTKLLGTWSEKKKEGMKYVGSKGEGLPFDKRRRKFTKVKL